MTDTIFAHPVTTAVIAGFLLIGIIGKVMKFSFERIAKWYLYVSVFSAVIVMNSIFFPFIGGKDYFFRFSVELALASVVLWWAFEAKKGELGHRVKALFKKPLVIATTVFVAIFQLACLFAYDANAAFWSNYERGEGGFQILHYYLFFLLLVFLFTEEKEWKNIFKFSLVATGFMILYGILGNYSVNGFIGPYAGGGAPTTGWWHTLVDGRFQGSLGNPAYVNAYLLFSMFYVGYLWTAAKIAGTLKKYGAWLYGILLAALLFFFVIGQTRGAFLGLAAGAFAAVIYIIFASKGKTRKWGAIALGILILLGVGIYEVRNTKFVQSFPEGRLLQISFSDSTAQSRFWVWHEAWQGFLQRPVLGWGPENFTAVYDQNFNTKFYVPGQSSETWFDRAHSIYFDYLCETGILGFLAYLAIFVTFFVTLFKKFHKDRREQGAEAHHKTALNIQRSLLVAVPVAYLIQGVAIFDVLPMYISLFMLLAFEVYYTHHEHAQ
ncbi:MAG: O-antigen ligase family protein [Candidatus Pacebacteria bacterium]|nr:O-antigen ligase family protein [Candidatus Paceibacterota bacterium]